MDGMMPTSARPARRSSAHCDGTANESSYRPSSGPSVKPHTSGAVFRNSTMEMRNLPMFTRAREPLNIAQPLQARLLALSVYVRCDCSVRYRRACNSSLARFFGLTLFTVTNSPLKFGSFLFAWALVLLFGGLVNPCAAQIRSPLCNGGDNQFQANYHTGIGASVGPGHSGGLATRACEADLTWEPQKAMVSER